MLSGEAIGKWIYSIWPMDIWATLVFTFLFISFLGYISLIRNNPINRKKIKELADWFFSRIIDLITFKWLKVIFQAFFYSKNGEPGLHFNLFQTMFVLCSFVILFRLSTGGKEMQGVQVGPNVLSPKQITATKGTSEVRAYYSIKKVISQPVNMYEILVLLIFTGFFYYRRDLKEGDQKDGLDRLIESGQDFIRNRYGHQQQNISTIATINQQTISPALAEESRTGEIEIHLTGKSSRMKTKGE